MKCIEFTKRVLACILVLATTSYAELDLGDNTHVSAGGQFGAAYSGAFTDQSGSGHGTGLSGDAFISGNYYNPAFLNFTSHPYYNRSQSTSDTVSITNGNGFDIGVNLFSGSQFPLSFGYGQNSGTTGQFAIPGASSFVTVGGGRDLSLSGSAFIPGWPSLTAAFTKSSSSGHILGIPGESSSRSHTFSITSNYELAGFSLNGSFDRMALSSQSPDVIDGSIFKSEGSNLSYGVNASRQMNFMRSSLGLSYAHSSSNFGVLGDSSDANHQGQSSNEFSAMETMQLHPRVSTGVTFNYVDNLSAAIAQQIISAGGAPINIGARSLKSMTLSDSVSWAAPKGFMVTGGFVRRQQTFQGISNASTQIFANVSYNYIKPFLGSFVANVTASDSANKAGNSGGGVTASLNYSRKLHGFEVRAGGSYSQSVQTQVNFVTSSGYSYGGGFGRKVLHGSRVSFNFGGSRTGFSTKSNSSSHSESYTASFSRRRYSINGHVSSATGYSLLTPNGLVVPTGTPEELLGPYAFVFNAHSMGMGGSWQPIRNATLSGSYGTTNAFSSSARTPDGGSHSESKFISVGLRYRLRKMYLTANFAQVRQGAGSALNSPLPTVTSYSFGISRSFRFF